MKIFGSSPSPFFLSPDPAGSDGPMLPLTHGVTKSYQAKKDLITRRQVAKMLCIEEEVCHYI